MESAKFRLTERQAIILRVLVCSLQHISNLLICCLYSSEPERSVEPLNVPEGSQVGDRITFDGAEQCTPDEKLNPKKKIWEKLQVWISLT